MQTYPLLYQSLTDFLLKFSSLTIPYQESSVNGPELEKVIDEYSTFILDEKNRIVWERLGAHQFAQISQIVDELRRHSSLCVGLMEKHRAWKLLDGEEDQTGYFRNIEAGIEQEFGRWRLDSSSKVLLVGSGAFPMTPLYIAKQTGAEVIGIDIDEGAVKLGNQVIQKLGSELRIRLENRLVEQLEGIDEVTHIIFSSTVALKYQLLDQLHSLTNSNVSVAMRFGNDLKSLFNYPIQPTDPQKWRVEEASIHPDQVFDVAYYKKA